MPAELEFEDLSFEKKDDSLVVTLYEIFQAKIPLEQLEHLGEMEVGGNSLSFPETNQKKAERTFFSQLDVAFRDLYCTTTRKSAMYIHANSGIPLQGYIGFGIIDRGTNLLEIKAMTGCNLNCNYCSVDEGMTTRKNFDFVIEEGYLFDEVKKIIPLKGSDDIEVHLNTQGEPTLYARFAQLCRDLRTIPQIKRISVNTNGMRLKKEKFDEYVDAGLTQINLSLNAVDPKAAKIIAGFGLYDVNHCMDLMRHAVTRCDVTISPTYIKGYNDEELPKIIDFFKELLDIKEKTQSPYKLRMGIQNFLYYKKGRNPAEQVPWEKFYQMLRDLEEEKGVQLIVKEGDFSITKAPPLPKTMKKGDVVKAQIMAPGRYKREVLAVANERTICVHQCDKTEGPIKVKIISDKDNLYNAVPA